jgi:hypothetical protein
VLRRALAASLLLVAVIAGAASARTKPQPTITRIPSEVTRAARTHAESPSATCTVGATGPAVNLVDYIVPPDDVYYTLLRQTDCPTCGGLGQGAHIDNANLTLDFPFTPCSLSVEVSLVKAGGFANCPTPLPNQLLCGPTTMQLLAPQDGGLADYQIPLNCNLVGNMFLKVVILEASEDCGLAGNLPLLVTSDTCITCTTYNQFDAFTLDLCDSNSALPGNPMMSVDISACALTDVPRGPTPGELDLSSFPNPAPAGVTFQFTLPRRARASLRVYDLAGAVVRTLLDGELTAGTHVALWDRSLHGGGRAGPGVYFYELRTEGVRIARQLVMLQ